MSMNRTRTRQSLERSLGIADHTATRILAMVCGITLALALGALSASAEEEPLDPKFRESVKTYLGLQGSLEQMGLSVAYNAANETLMAIAQTGVQVTEPMQNIVLEQAIETYASRFGDIEFLTDLWAPIYAKHYTQKEISSLIDFYQSPLGKKSLELFGPINEEGMAAIQESVFAITPGFQLGVNAKLEAAGIPITPGGPGAPAQP